MRIATFKTADGPATGIVDGDRLIPTGRPGDATALMADWPAIRADLENKAAAGGALALREADLLAPVLRPGKIFAIGLNYADHIAESKMETPKEQVWFTKAVTSINAPFAPIRIARGGDFVDYEVELVAVIGRPARYVSRAEARSHVFGYCVGNDVTERVWQHRVPQWSLGKSFDSHAPIGPWIVTDDEIVDPHDLDLRCFVNGEERQSSNTRHLVFDIWDQIEHLSQAMTLEPGDLLFTGTPAGVGAAMQPRQFLKPGDVLRSEVSGIGMIEGRMEADG